MKRGRKGDRPAVKKAKAGQFRAPDRRKRASKPKLSNEVRAEMLSSLAPGEVPGFMTENRDFDSALTIWSDLSPALKRMNALSHPDRYAFAMYCVHMANWIEAEKEIKKHGATYIARNTVNGDELQKLNPWVRVREISERHILEIGARFGLDPLNRFKMVAAQIIGAQQGRLPLGDETAPPQQGDGGDAITGFQARNAGHRPN